ncbi:TIGR01777 family protein [bacterium (Candidatus Blackallbacteria) CG17_big_fil_post_rev_8_21_14_2_50_48_46]|uniref:TIGR01777 family protein n=1 Tax=bacterium (Candidatus Blackallbacteria) CG17_big_fil_post_rev_8_21_14_2_50_48_46 TaxID=2014261 RepID=A0A2M7G0F7_9BACT|nr:MAG: TIGR01777 family protein [bacterium (Candidatus Blackallbacteria) CG18_big_fil_WC_8_21_14_2_50_49_26]PIW15204.1 MAG: TIGR01777 family protein [bacterium (Candidatus Blackallbacteria) CG17_big_fil_post_rev_8_21_14_2_50_48_46]PIW44791.1 MAG: TIGR01777 family protein [bacterium (Candidatus Blackallbacteria) CG13_big_fil_rev_8_21_14_2_50_49_14]
MKILVSGASGLIGSALIPNLTAGGHEVLRLVRRRSENPSTVYWNPVKGEIDQEALEGLDAVIHLAGESIADGRWSEAKKQSILKSRVEGTLLVAEALARLKKPPECMISASAIGYYGDRGEEELCEDSPPGDDFLAEVCQKWEDSCEPARQAGIRVVNPRIGIVLSCKGGALEKMLMPFQLGLGGVLGNGHQYLSWVAIDDVLAAFLHILATPSIQGPINLVAPEPLTNSEFTRTLGKILLRPTILPVPAFSLRALMGEMADSLLLSSAFVSSEALMNTGFRFQYPDIVSALRHVLGAKRK